MGFTPLTGGVMPAGVSRANAVLGFDADGRLSLYDATDDSPAFVAEGDGAAARTMLAKARERVSVTDFGASGANTGDQSAAINAAAQALHDAGGGTLFVPRGKYRLEAPVNIPLNANILIDGEGEGAAIIRQADPTLDGIVFTNDNFKSVGGGVRNLTIEAGPGLLTNNNNGIGSSGTGLKITRGNDSFNVANVAVHNFSNGMDFLGCWNIRVQDFRILYFDGVGLRRTSTGGVAGGSNVFTRGKISNSSASFDRTGSIGINVRHSGGEMMSQIDITSAWNGVVVDPAAGDLVAYLFLTTVLADSCLSDAWIFDASAGDITSGVALDCWGGFSRGGHGLVTKGSGLDSLQWQGRLRENWLSGWSHQGGKNVVVTAEIARNSQGTNNTDPGVSVAAGVSDWALLNSRIGNFASGVTNQQAEGLVIAAGASNRFRVIGNDFSNPGSGKSCITNGATGTDVVITDNLPRATAGLNPTGATPLFGVAQVAAGATGYLGAGGYNSSVASTAWRARRSGVITEFQVYTNNAPGAGQTYTYTLVVNGVESAVTATSTGASSFSATASGAVAVTAGQTVSIKVVTTAGAAVSQHGYNLRVE